MKFGQFMYRYKIIFLNKKMYKKVAWKPVLCPFLNLQRNLYKKESGETSMLIWTNFGGSFAITYLCYYIASQNLKI